MESRRQVTVSWDSGGSDEAPPKVLKMGFSCILYPKTILASLFHYKGKQRTGQIQIELLKIVMLQSVQWEAPTPLKSCPLEIDWFYDFDL